jgi:hypothetical protein
MTPPPPLYKLGQQVRLILTKEVGTVTQVCANLHGEPQYRVRVDIAFNQSLFRAAAQSDLEPAS